MGFRHSIGVARRRNQHAPPFFVLKTKPPQEGRGVLSPPENPQHCEVAKQQNEIKKLLPILFSDTGW